MIVTYLHCSPRYLGDHLRHSEREILMWCMVYHADSCVSWSVKRYLVHRPCPCLVAYTHFHVDARPHADAFTYTHAMITHAHTHAHRHAHASPFSSRSPLRPITVIPRIPACRHRDDIDHPSPLVPLVSPPLHALLHLPTAPSSRSNAI